MCAGIALLCGLKRVQWVGVGKYPSVERGTGGYTRTRLKLWVSVSDDLAVFGGSSLSALVIADYVEEEVEGDAGQDAEDVVYFVHGVSLLRPAPGG